MAYNSTISDTPILCAYCGEKSLKTKKQIRRSRKVGRAMFCDNSCACKYNSLTLAERKLRKEGQVLPDVPTTFVKLTEKERVRNRIISQMVANAKDRCKKSGRECNISVESIRMLDERQRGMCALSGVKLNYEICEGKPIDRVSLDRIDSTKGYVEGNIQLVTWIVNVSKLDFRQEDYLTMCKNVVDFNHRPE